MEQQRRMGRRELGGDECDDGGFLGRVDHAGRVAGAASPEIPSSGQEQSAADGADRVLAERFARGEIDDAEFTRSRTILHPPSDRK